MISSLEPWLPASWSVSGTYKKELLGLIFPGYRFLLLTVLAQYQIMFSKSLQCLSLFVTWPVWAFQIPSFQLSFAGQLFVMKLPCKAIINSNFTSMPPTNHITPAGPTNFNGQCSLPQVVVFGIIESSVFPMYPGWVILQLTVFW